MKIGKRGIIAALLVIMLLGVTGCKKDPQKLTTGEKLECLEIDGKAFPIPCKVGDMGKGFKIGYGLGHDEGFAIADLTYNNQEIGKVYLADCNTGKIVVDMSTGYEDKWIYCIYLDNPDAVDFDLLGVTFSATYDDIVETYGTPTIDARASLTYADAAVENDDDFIFFSYDRNGKMMSCLLNAKMGDLK